MHTALPRLVALAVALATTLAVTACYDSTTQGQGRTVRTQQVRPNAVDGPATDPPNDSRAVVSGNGRGGEHKTDRYVNPRFK